MQNTPAFQYYPADLISDPDVMFWDMEQIGAYWTMITFLWLNNGRFEYDLEIICKLFRKKKKNTAERLWNKISSKFILENNIVTHKRVTREIVRQTESRLKRSEAGKKGMQNRWENHNNVNNKPITDSEFGVITKNNTSSSTSTSINNINIYTTENEVLTEAVLIGITEEQAKAFYSHYKSQGWKFGNGLPITDLSAALVRWRNNDYKFDIKTTPNQSRMPVSDRPSRIEIIKQKLEAM
ncbi:MAG: hypothetical protein A2Y12_01210 [Planctomycetes bacterium GWF2_42_9]|nr:MAG: hypothetical protein A2Y12_01210 [Planctomycetes bacterium GWF2_42_9]